MKLDLSSFQKALESLGEVLKLPVDSIIRDSAIQRFEYTYELAYKMLKRYLEMSSANPSEIDGMNFKEIIRLGAEQGLIDKPENWFVYRNARNETSHGYSEDKAISVYSHIAAFEASAQNLLNNLSEKLKTL